LRADHGGLGAEVFSGVLANGLDVPAGRGIGGEIDQIAFLHVAGKDDRFGAEEEKAFEQGEFFGAEVEDDGGFPFVELGQDFFEQGEFGLGLHIAAAGVFGQLVFAFLEGGHVGEDQLGIDHFDIADRVHCAGHVMNVLVLKATDDLHDGIDFADMAEELVAESFALAGAFDQPGDIDEFDGGGDGLFRLGKRGQSVKPWVGNADDADVRLDRAERKIGRLRLAGAGDGVEEGGLAHVGKSDNSGLKHRCGRVSVVRRG